jgi:hypothetical protein
VILRGYAARASAVALAGRNVGESVLHGGPFAENGAAGAGLLELAEPSLARFVGGN